MDKISLKVAFLGDNPEKQAIFFTQYIAKKSITALEKIEPQRSEYKDGQMGLGTVLGSVAILIKAANEPLVELVKALRDYVSSLRSEVEIHTEDGRVFKISTATPQKTGELVKLILDNSKSNSQPSDKQD